MISIITVTFNAGLFLERTIKSVLAQTNQDFEYIIIDGKSSDNTLSVVKLYEKRVDVMISEPDKGLYDAMNKGIKVAKGDYLWFLNAGDEINEDQVIAKLNAIIVKNNSDIIYSDTYFVNNENEEIGLRSKITPHTLPEKLKWQDMKLGMKVCHQSFIAKKSIAPFFMNDNLSADIDWEIKCLKSAKKIEMVQFVLSRYLTGGISNRNLFQSLNDRFKVLLIHYGFIPTIFAHFKILWRGIILIFKTGKYW